MNANRSAPVRRLSQLAVAAALVFTLSPVSTAFAHEEAGAAEGRGAAKSGAEEQGFQDRGIGEQDGEDRESVDQGARDHDHEPVEQRSVKSGNVNPRSSWESTTGPPLTKEEPILFGFDLVPALGTSSAAPNRPRIFSLNLVGGMSGGTRLFELGGAFNLNSGDVQGLQIAGALNVIQGSVSGIQIAGAVNSLTGHVRGAQIAGAANVNSGKDVAAGLQVAGGVNLNAGDFMGLQAAGGANVNGGDSLGVRLAGGANVNQGSFSGTQAAGGVNVSGGDVEGMRLAGGANVSGGTVQGLQAAGAVNVNRESFTGFQVAGAANISGAGTQGVQIAPVNVTRGHVSGVQVGVVNVSESATVSIAPIGVYLGGFVQPELYGSDDGLLMAGIRHGRRSFYHLYSVGTRLVRIGDDGPTLAAGLGFGWRFELGERVELTADLTTTLGVAETSDWDWDSRFTIHKFRPMISVSLLDYLTIFGGPTLSLSVKTNASSADPADDGLISPWVLSDTVSMWPGFTVGVRFL